MAAEDGRPGRGGRLRGIPRPVRDRFLLSMSDLEIIPKAEIEHMGVKLPELDTDAVLARRPQIALVDELAHTNAPGSRHEKRWQDVEELLCAGIDVYTTVNIQHFESLNDIVAQITGIKVRETVPDRLLDEAAEIRLVDIPPDELLQRLKEGKVYIPEQAALATEKFFKPGNLMALRELSMRRAAARVDEEMRAYMESRSIAGPWPVAETAPGLRQRQPLQREADPHHPPAGGRDQEPNGTRSISKPRAQASICRRTGNGSGATCGWLKAWGRRWLP